MLEQIILIKKACFTMKTVWIIGWAITRTTILDYKVTPIYQKDELIPRKIELQYVGINYLEAVAKNTVKKPLENGFLL